MSADRFPRPLGDEFDGRNGNGYQPRPHDYVAPHERIPPELRPWPTHRVVLLLVGFAILVVAGLPDAAEWISTWPACRP